MSSTENEVPAETIRLEAPRKHAQVKKWVVFSDLHVKSASINTCEEVLDAVHAEALRLSQEGKVETGIIFLGDFWHARGALRVELLNRVLRALQKWTVPVVMIPGNHDQVSLGGQVHALEPLVYAFNGREEQILLISEPTVCMGALWLPYRRDHKLLRDALTACAPAIESGEVSVIFCHADVKGAKMNDNIISRSGADIGMFPGGVPVYSGHFHKPHTLQSRSRRLTYVGSPYQTSLSEAHQQKYLYCLPMSESSSSSKKFVWCQEPGQESGGELKVPLTLGRRYHRATLGLQDPLLGNEEEVRPGDRVVLYVKAGEMRERGNQALFDNLRSRGVELELRHERLESDMRLSRALRLQAEAGKVGVNVAGMLDAEASAPLNRTIESLNQTQAMVPGANELAGGIDLALRDPLTIFGEYVNRVARLSSQEGNKANDTASDLRTDILARGQEILVNLTADQSMSNSAGNNQGVHRELTLQQVTLRHFGPFGSDQPTTYPLSGRGLVLLRGEAATGGISSSSSSLPRSSGGESNGAGKTTLVMSVLWALSGALDGRVVSDGRATDVAYDGNAGGSSSSTSSSRKPTAPKAAQVSVSGLINGESFEITRKRGAKRSSLKFVLGGNDITAQSQRDTQALIDEKLGTGQNLLQRSCFFGQHATAGSALLGLTDARLKAELSPLVQHSSLWVTAAAQCRATERSLRQGLAALEVEERIRREEWDTGAARSVAAAEALAVCETELVKASSRIQADIVAFAADLGLSPEDFPGSRNNSTGGLYVAERAAVQSKLDSLRGLSSSIHESAISAVRERSDAISALQQQIATLRERSKSLQTAVNSSRAGERSGETEAVSARARIEQIMEALTKDHAELLALSPFLDSPLTEVLAGTGADVADASLDGLPAMPLPSLLAQVLRSQAAETAISLRIESAIASLASLGAIREEGEEEVDECHSKHNPVSDGEGGAVCGACGQALDPALLELRRRELSALQANLSADLVAATELTAAWKKASDVAERINDHYEHYQLLRSGQDEAARLSLQMRDAVQATEEEALLVARELNNAMRERDEMSRAVEESEMARQSEQEQVLVDTRLMEEKLSELDAARELHQTRLDALRRRQTAGQEELSRLQTAIEDAKEACAQRAADVISLKAVCDSLDTKQEALQGDLRATEHLTALFGTRGIQNHCFSETLQQLELLTNLYLLALSGGELQLVLRSTGGEGSDNGNDTNNDWADDLGGVEANVSGSGCEDESRIVRSVLVRGGEDSSSQPISGVTGAEAVVASDHAVLAMYRRRALSQLSGGQWKRAQLALDLAYAECVRRRGLLRSNILVMDEVLTHLDAPGREAAGEVLRSMVRSAGADGPSNGDGDVEREEEEYAGGDGAALSANSGHSLLSILTPFSYDTLVMILQDFAAAELEEGFDHVDVVKRTNGVSAVELDGGIEIKG
jgi:DNA repair exonuclease SbcCD ATPase subunit